MASNLKDRFGNTFFFVFAFIPFLQWIPCFIMNGRVRTKRLIIMGFVNIAALMALIIVPSTVDGYIDRLFVRLLVLQCRRLRMLFVEL